MSGDVVGVSPVSDTAARTLAHDLHFTDSYLAAIQLVFGCGRDCVDEVRVFNRRFVDVDLAKVMSNEPLHNYNANHVCGGAQMGM